MTEWKDTEIVEDDKKIKMVNYKNLFGSRIGKVDNPNLINEEQWFKQHFRSGSKKILQTRRFWSFDKWK